TSEQVVIHIDRLMDEIIAN
ncbi:hypothetical protein D046_6396B, partial [Vibrio parahaemolyticus V-223/04]